VESKIEAKFRILPHVKVTGGMGEMSE